jgi:hypothetical protein
MFHFEGNLEDPGCEEEVPEPVVSPLTLRDGQCVQDVSLVRVFPPRRSRRGPSRCRRSVHLGNTHGHLVESTDLQPVDVESGLETLEGYRHEIEGVHRIESTVFAPVHQERPRNIVSPELPVAGVGLYGKPRELEAVAGHAKDAIRLHQDLDPI